MTRTFDRLVIFKDKLTQKVDQSIVTYIPDQDYLARHNNDVSHNQITRLDSDFSGYIQYRNWDDKIQFILQIQNGKSVKVLKYNSSGVSATAAPRSVTAGSAPRQTDAIVCTIQTIYHYEQMCYYTVTEEGTTESCGDWEYAGSDTYTDCFATHTAMLNSWISQMSSTLQQSFWISAADGIAIALSGISDVLMDNNLTPFPAMDAFVQKNYNTTIAAAGVIGNAYEAGTKGKKCP